MVAIQVRDVPEAVRERLAVEAERRGQSLQLFLMDVLKREAASADNLRWLREVSSRPIARVSPDLDIAEIIRAGHLERDEQIMAAVNHPDLDGES